MRDMIRRSRLRPPKTTRKLLEELHDLVQAYEGAKGPITRASLADTLIHWMPRVLEIVAAAEADRVAKEAVRRAQAAELAKARRRKT